MTHIFNDPKNFVDESKAGFLLANQHLVIGVDGGVVRASGTPRGEVAIVVGGGSGHYPAFGGVVGQGLAHGAAMGNVFASPSAQQIYKVAKQAENGAGVLFCFGNYAGDVLNFKQAEQRLRDEGIDCETVVVTDDIASADKAEQEKRRGIAGDLAVFKAAAFAAEQGMDLSRVKKFAIRANLATATLGIAFGGCTLPGSKEPLFSVRKGFMEIGMGIHGEPGLEEQPMASASEISKILVSQLLEERPSGANRATAILSGLGAVKYEELFLLYKFIVSDLEAAGISVLQPEVGELVTSFDMAGVSLTLHYLDDDELLQAWSAATETPGYKKGSINPAKQSLRSVADSEASAHLVKGGAASHQDALLALKVFDAIESLMEEKLEMLGEIDSIAGDGDHGIGMQRGTAAAKDAAAAAVAAGAGLKDLLQQASDAWSDKAGGTSGAIWGVILGSLAKAADNELPTTKEQLAAGFQLAILNVQEFGKAQVGDKTMVDALLPFAAVLSSSVDSGLDLKTSWKKAADAAIQAANETKDFVAKVGRARPHAEKSLGTPDPGALSLALIAVAAASVLGEQK